MAKRTFAHPSAASKVLVVLLIIVGTGLVLSLGASTFGAFVTPSAADTIDSDAYQAVHLTDGQIMFGKLSVIDATSLELKDTYFIADTSDDTSVTKDKLLRHASQPYGPSGSVVINRDQVLFWENLEDTGLVTETISNTSNEDR